MRPSSQALIRLHNEPQGVELWAWTPEKDMPHVPVLRMRFSPLFSVDVSMWTSHRNTVDEEKWILLESTHLTYVNCLPHLLLSEGAGWLTLSEGWCIQQKMCRLVISAE